MKSKWLLLLIFFISVIIRIPNLDRPLSKHHEFNAALILIPIDNWNQTSPFDFNFGPVMSYQNEMICTSTISPLILLKRMANIIIYHSLF